MNKNTSNGRIIMADIIAEKAEIKKKQKRQAKKQRENPDISGRKKLKFITAGVLIFTVIVLVLSLLSSALVKINLNNKTIDVEAVYRAGLEGQEINLEKFTFKEKSIDSEPTSKTKEFKEKASGEIVIFNAYSSKPQVLVAQTRFETPDGKIYKIDKRITIPGADIFEGKIKPSSITATVYAEKPGEEYNIDGPIDFTIPGFKGSPKFNGFYAKSKTEMSGGFLGKARVVSQEDVDKLKERVLNYLEGALENKLSKNLPPDFIQPQKAKRINVKQETIVPQIGERGDNVEMEVEAEIESFAVLKKDLENLLVVSYLGEEFKDKVKISNIKELSISAENIGFERGEFDLLVRGKARFVWLVDHKKLKEDLANRKGKKIREVFSEYPQIKSAEIIFRPSFWRFFPKNKDKIIIEESAN